MKTLLVFLVALLTSAPLLAQNSLSLVRNKAQVIASQLNDNFSNSGAGLPTEFNYQQRKIYAVPISVAERYGGNGYDQYIAVYELSNDSRSQNQSSSPSYSLIAFSKVGAKMWRSIEFESIQFANDTFYFDAVRWGPNDPGCCPSQEVRIGYRITDFGLVEI